MTKRASSETLDNLHGTVAQNYLDEIRKYKGGTYSDEDGNPKPIPANLLAPLDVLKHELPDFSNTKFG
jgi:hypothetical protein